jgi:hypothetical protein
MNTYADKAHENKSQSVTNAVSQKKSGGSSTFQFLDNRPEVIAQRKLQEMANDSPQVKQAAQLQAMADNYTAQQQPTIQKRKNNTGLPDNLKSGIENLSGYSMDNVKVHYNSDKPAQLQAHAYAQGNDIHIASGQEKHLPHEAWHVVQQKQGRVKPTMQLKCNVNVNDDAGLEKEADVMGDRASQHKASVSTQETKKNQFAVSSPILQRYQIVKKSGNVEEVLFSNKEKKPNENGNLDHDGYHYFNKQNKATQTYYGRSPTGSHSIELQAESKGKGSEFTNNKKNIENAFGFGTGNLKTIIDSQHFYQQWITTFLSKGEIMNLHRSIGLEYEFATFDDPANQGLGSHVILAKSAKFSNLFNLPFVLETDSSSELEVGTPPLLASDIDGKPNTQGINRIHQVFKNTLEVIREKYYDKDITTIPMSQYGLGQGWTWKPQSNGLKIGLREKHRNSDKKIYSQLNISLTNKEAAEYMDGKGKEKYNSYEPRPHEQFNGAYAAIKQALEAKVPHYISEAAADTVNTANILFSRGLANLLAIPSIMYVGTNGDYNTSVHSAVKETYGIWIKNSIANQVTTSLVNTKDRKVYKQVLSSAQDKITTDLLQLLQTALTHLPVASAPTHKAYENAFKGELKQAFKDVLTRLKRGQREKKLSQRGHFGNEQFDGTGEGVRKETFVRIQRGNYRELHLSEIRNDTNMELFLDDPFNHSIQDESPYHGDDVVPASSPKEHTPAPKKKKRSAKSFQLLALIQREERDVRKNETFILRHSHNGILNNKAKKNESTLTELKSKLTGVLKALNSIQVTHGKLSGKNDPIVTAKSKTYQTLLEEVNTY